MKMPICRIAACVLAMAWVPAHADIYKCRQGERVTYQERPCPNNSQAVAALPEDPGPSAYEAEQARARARGEIREAAALRKRDDKAAEAQDKKRAVARKQETDCTRLHERIDRAETRDYLTKQQRATLKGDQRKYTKECGPL